MNLIKNFKILYIFLILVILNFPKSIALENKILFKVNNEIITTIDIYEEIKFLKIFNPEVNSLNETELLSLFHKLNFKSPVSSL